MIFEPHIDNEALNKLDIGAYEGEVKIVYKEEDVNEAVKHLSQYRRLGFDTETRPSFKKGKTYPVALLQLASEEYVYIFKLQKMNAFEGIRKLLNHPEILKIGADIKDDVRKLNHFFPVKKDSFLELQKLVGDYGIKDISLRKMTAIVLGFRISKSQQISNWETDPLEEAQVRYASTDAWVALQIYNKLKLSFVI